MWWISEQNRFDFLEKSTFMQPHCFQKKQSFLLCLGKIYATPIFDNVCLATINALQIEQQQQRAIMVVWVCGMHIWSHIILRWGYKTIMIIHLSIIMAQQSSTQVICSIHLSSCLLMQVLVVNGTFELNVVKNNPCEMQVKKF